MMQYPLIIILSFWSLAVSPRIGPNLKILGLLFVALPLGCYPVLMIGGSIFTAVGICFMYAIDLSRPCSFHKIARHTVETVRDVWDYGSRTIPATLRGFRDNACANPTDIRIVKLVFLTIMFFVATALDGVAITLYGLVMLVPYIIQ